MIYLDNSATTFPKPEVVRDEIRRSLTFFGANPGRSGYALGMRTSEAVYDARETTADFFGADTPECVLFQPGCTQALNVVIQSVLSKGDHVLVSDLEHNAVMRPLEWMRTKGITYEIVATNHLDSIATVNAFKNAITPKTKLIVCTHASNVFGMRLPIKEIAELAHDKEIKICVDSAQTAGLVPIHMGNDNIDYLCVAGHKALYGPMGIGALLIREDDTKVKPLVFGGTGTESNRLIQPDTNPEQFESGTLNISGILGLRAGIRFVEKYGMNRILTNEMRLIQYLYGLLSPMSNILLYTEFPDTSHFVPVLSLNVKGYDSEEVGAHLARCDIAVRCGLHCAPLAHQKMGTENGSVRISLSVFTKKGEIQSLVSAIKRMKHKW